MKNFLPSLTTFFLFAFETNAQITVSGTSGLYGSWADGVYTNTTYTYQNYTTYRWSKYPFQIINCGGNNWCLQWDYGGGLYTASHVIGGTTTKPPSDCWSNSFEFGTPTLSGPDVIILSIAEINVSGNATAIVDGDNIPSATDHTDFGTTFPSTPVAKTYTIDNTGTQALTVSSIGMTGAQASNYTVAGITFPATIAPGGSSTFTVTFQGTSVQVYNAEVVINNNDCNEGIYNYAVKAEISCQPAAFSACPPNISVNTTTNQCNAVVNYTATVTGAGTPVTVAV